MSNRDDALRRIFDATGVSGRLTDDQKRELLTHLDDAVQAKIDAGVPELDAVGQAFIELGPLKKIVDQFPREAVAVTPEGGLLTTWSRGAALKGLVLLGIFAFIQSFLIPKFAQMFLETGTPAPGLTLMFIAAGQSDLVPLTALVLAALAVLQVVARRKGWTRQAVRRLQLSALALYSLVAVVSAALAVGCGMGIAALFTGLVP